MYKSKFERIQLEMSLKAFFKTDQKSIDKVCEKIFINWESLADRSEEIAIMLWVSDGAEILEWHGDFNEEISWGRYIGFCNFNTASAFPRHIRHYKVNQAQYYIEDPAIITFQILKNIISGLRKAAKKHLNKEIMVGATLDPGPEFADSKFKFEDHPEVLIPDNSKKQPNMMHFITHQATLKKDDRAYGGFPKGIPEGTPFGEFIGKQFASLQKNLGYDYIWFSNGFAYTHYPWGYQGEIFDGYKFKTSSYSSNGYSHTTGPGSVARVSNARRKCGVDSLASSLICSPFSVSIVSRARSVGVSTDPFFVILHTDMGV